MGDLEIRVGCWLAVLASAYAPAARAACRVDRGDFDGSGRDDLRIVGDGRPQTIRILDGQGTYQVQIDCDDDGTFTGPGDVDTGVVAGDIETYDVEGGGQDTITFGRLPSTTWSGASKDLLLTLGPAGTRGNTVTVGLQSLPAEMTSASSLVVDLLGSTGRDSISVNAGTMTDSQVVIRGDLASGDDTLSVSASGATRSVLSVDVDLGPGNNSATFRVPPIMDDATATYDVAGGKLTNQSDTVAWLSQGSMVNGSRVAMTVNLQGGADVFEGLLGAPSIDVRSAIDLRVRGGTGDDVLTLGAPPSLRTTAANAGTIGLAFSGGPGNDRLTIELDSGISGTGLTRLALDGGDGDDLAIAAATLDASAGTPLLEATLRGGPGADVVYASPVQRGGSAGVDILQDGGEGNDHCPFFDAGQLIAHTALRCETTF